MKNYALGTYILCGGGIFMTHVLMILAAGPWRPEFSGRAAFLGYILLAGAPYVALAVLARTRQGSAWASKLVFGGTVLAVAAAGAVYMGAILFGPEVQKGPIFLVTPLVQSVWAGVLALGLTALEKKKKGP